MLALDTAYRSFGGEVEASSTPTICRLPDSRRHQLSAIALDCRRTADMASRPRSSARLPCADGVARGRSASQAKARSVGPQKLKSELYQGVAAPPRLDRSFLSIAIDNRDLKLAGMSTSATVSIAGFACRICQRALRRYRPEDESGS